MSERLTDADLDALGKDGNWDSRYGERAIAELRELRAEHSECQAIIDSAEAHATAWKAEYNKSFDENAKLVAAATFASCLAIIRPTEPRP